ncbi:MAG: MerC domain-containing protein [Ferruginibacter sp.]
MTHNKTPYQSKWDAVGIGASFICAIHCVLLPLFLSSLSFLGIEFLHNTSFEIITISTSLVVGSWALYNGCHKQHHYRWPMIAFIAGMGFLAAALWLKSGPWEMVLKALAAVCIITAHIFNWRYSRSCNHIPVSH